MIYVHCVIWLSLALTTISAIFYGYMVRRNDAVHAYRKKVLDLIGQRAKANNYEYSDGEFDKYSSVSYEEMLYRFWRPLSYWDEKIGKKDLES